MANLKDNWREFALCASSDLDFFDHEGEDSNARNWNEQRALCKACPVIMKCSLDAMETDLRFCSRSGIGFNFAGGMSPIERFDIREKTGFERRELIGLTYE